MEGGGRKRKMEKEQEEEDENEKMEKFFALIRRTREVREMMGMDGEKKKGSDQEDKPPVVSAVWNPTFRPEDFVELDRANPQSKAHTDHDHKRDDHAITPPALPVVVLVAGPSKREEDESQKQGHDKGGGGDGDGLDLKLSL